MAKEPPREHLARLAAARPMVELAEILRTRDAAAASGLWGSSVAAVTAVMQQDDIAAANLATHFLLNVFH